MNQNKKNVAHSIFERLLDRAKADTEQAAEQSDFIVGAEMSWSWAIFINLDDYRRRFFFRDALACLRFFLALAFSCLDFPMAGGTGESMSTGPKASSSSSS